MFNALRPDELLVGVGGVLRLVAAAPGPLEEYERSQALSAYSVTRLLAAEERAAAGLLSDTKRALRRRDRGRRAAGRTRAAGRVARRRTGPRSATPSPRCWHCSPPTSHCGHACIAILATMIDAEVAALADVRAMTE